VAHCDLEVWFASDRTVKNMNAELRGVNKATDVIAIPTQEIVPGRRPKKMGDIYDIGGIALGLGYIHKKSLDQKMPFEEHITAVIIHGVCHLLGYTHDGLNDFRQMRQKEAHVLRRLKAMETDTVGLAAKAPKGED